MLGEPTITIWGMEEGKRVESRILEERIQQAVSAGHRFIEVVAYGQHGIGGRLFRAGNDPVYLRVLGTSGQRLGSMGFPNTTILTTGPASDDVGWLNAGATIIVSGHGGNGVGNAMAQGKIYIGGDIGARGMTMTKHNPRFAPPELWVLGSVGDSFAEFMAGGIAVICGYGKEKEENVLGYRPCVGMVGGKIFFRGKLQGFSEKDAKLVPLEDEDWQWLTANMPLFLKAIGKDELLPLLVGERSSWQLLIARKPYEKGGKGSRTVKEFIATIWNKELGPGGLLGDLTDIDRSVIELIPTGDLRRYVPLWENGRYLPPCQAHCPTGIPVQKRWELIRKGKIDEAINLILQYTPFAATVCGYLCPNLCMENCSRKMRELPPVDTTVLGRASLMASPPQPLPPSGFRVAVIGGGPAGLSVAWQLWLKGHEVTVFDRNDSLGGKIKYLIPRSRIADEILEYELKRIRENLKNIRFLTPLTRDDFRRIKREYDFVVIATGAQKPRLLSIPGVERAIAALDFLRASKEGKAMVGKRVVIIGAGNVGCDAASEAARLGAEKILLLDVQKPASHGKERKQAEAAGAKFLWPRFTKAITQEGVALTTGEVIPADTVIISIGDLPELDFLTEDIETVRGFIVVNECFQTSNPQVFAIGDAVKLGLLTEAIGMGRKAAEAIDSLLKGKEVIYDQLPPMDPKRVKLEYYDPRLFYFDDPITCADNCASCGVCRDCGICEAICPKRAIVRKEGANGAFSYEVDTFRCIGCGFCAGACPCGIWRLVENEPME